MLELLIALGAGLISFLSPCVLPLIPGYISYISGNSLNELIEKKKHKLNSNISFHNWFFDCFYNFWCRINFSGSSFTSEL